METVVCPKCQGTEVYVSVPSPFQKKMGYMKTGNCTSNLSNELKCGYIYEIYDGNKPKVEFTRFGVLATTANVKTNVIKVLKDAGEHQKSQQIMNLHENESYESFEEFIDLCKEYVELIEV